MFIENTPATYKIAVVAADGTLTVSDAFTQTMRPVTVTYDLSALSIVESDGRTIGVMIDETPVRLPEAILAVGAMLVLSVLALLLLRSFGYRKKETFVFIGLFNTVVIGVVVVLLTLNQDGGFPLFGALTMLFVALAVFGQMTYLSLTHPELKPSRALAYAVLANPIIAVSLLYFQANFLLVLQPQHRIPFAARKGGFSYVSPSSRASLF
ncbi:MAG: hypothetical protein MZU97_06440 [Bacillus subtilis]|nr:hypothetical protein [Bacillus subtilis]